MTDIKLEDSWEEVLTLSTLQEMELELQEAQYPENIPEQLISHQTNPAYIKHIVNLEQMYQALSSGVATFNAEEDSPFVMTNDVGVEQFVSVSEPAYVIAESIISRQTELGSQCLKTLLMFSGQTQAREEAVHKLKVYLPSLDNKFLALVIKQDNAGVLDLLLAHEQCLLDTLLPPEKTGKLHAAPAPTVLEAIVKQDAIKCLMIAIKQQKKVDFLALASDGRPLASHVLTRAFSDPIRMACIRDVPEFSDESFYQDALIALQAQPRFLEDTEVAYVIHKRVSCLKEQQEQLAQASGEHVLKKTLQLEALQHVAQAVDVEIVQAQKTNRQFRSVLNHAASDLYLQCKMFSDVKSGKASQHLNSMSSKDCDVYVAELLSSLEHLQAFLHFSMPGYEVSSHGLAPSACKKVCAYYFEKLQAAGVMKLDPFETKSKSAATATQRTYTLANGMQNDKDSSHTPGITVKA
jgi:hypothetical protein